MSQETGGAIEGRVTYLGEMATRSHEKLAQVGVIAAESASHLLDINRGIADLTRVSVEAAFNLNDISKHTKMLYDVVDELKVIKRNTNGLVSRRW